MSGLWTDRTKCAATSLSCSESGNGTFSPYHWPHENVLSWVLSGHAPERRQRFAFMSTRPGAAGSQTILSQKPVNLCSAIGIVTTTKSIHLNCPVCSRNLAIPDELCLADQ